MKRILFIVAVAVLSSQVCVAQQPLGTTVQLPTVRSFGINTTVSVPDGGTLYIGGVGSSGSSSVSRGGSRGIGSSVAGPGVSISAQLIIGAEVDAELERLGRLAIARKARPDIHGTTEEKARASFIARNLARGLK